MPRAGICAGGAGQPASLPQTSWPHGLALLPSTAGAGKAGFIPSSPLEIDGCLPAIPRSGSLRTSAGASGRGASSAISSSTCRFER